MLWNIAAEGCFPAQGNCIGFHTRPFHLPQWLLGFVNEELFKSVLAFSFSGKSMEPKYFSFPNHTFCSQPWISFKFQVICGSFMLLPCFISFIFYKNKPLTALPLRRQTYYRIISYLVFWKGQPALCVLNNGAFHSPLSSCTCKLQPHVRHLLRHQEKHKPQMSRFYLEYKLDEES